MNKTHIQWAIDTLCDKGYQIQSNANVMQNNPWSSVYRFKTNEGFIFLKKVPSALSLESNVIKLLQSEFHANVPMIMAENHEEHCFLMHDSGISLHEYFKKNFEENTFIKIVHDYSMLQMNISEKINLFLNMEVPDWRLKKMLMLYQELITQETLLLNEGLSKNDLVILNQLMPKFTSICEQLSHYNIKDTFGHADFHDKNILIDPRNQQATLIDLGEVVITHPFFSFHNCLHMAKENFVLRDELYQKIQLECLKPWLELETQSHLLEILSLIQECWSIHAVLGELRLLNSVDKTDFQKLHRQGRLAKKLRYWIDQGVNDGN